MTPEEYAAIRRSLGTQERVGRAVGRDKQTLSNRERGIQPIDREAELAIRYLQERPDEIPG